jgi:hypothetical protein
MTTLNRVIVRATRKTRKSGKRRYAILHDQNITPPRSDFQILAALKQQFEILNFSIADGTAIALVGEKTDETE